MRLDVVAVVLLLVVIGLQLRARVDRRRAARVARDTKSEAAVAAAEARQAAETARRILERIEGVSFDNRNAAGRIEDAAEVVAVDLEAAHRRASEERGSS